jgi:hypothetical protein
MIGFPWLKCEYRQQLEFVYREVSRLINKYRMAPIFFAGFITLTVLTSACSLINRGESGEILGSEQLLSGEAELLCSSECIERGQCGTAEQEKMVLLNSTTPATFGHDMAIRSGMNVTIVDEKMRTAVQLANNENISITFYLVNITDSTPGWVAGWCIGQ